MPLGIFHMKDHEEECNESTIYLVTFNQQMNPCAVGPHPLLKSVYISTLEQ
jgi:hypothetical protein